MSPQKFCAGRSAVILLHIPWVQNLASFNGKKIHVIVIKIEEVKR